MAEYAPRCLRCGHRKSDHGLDLRTADCRRAFQLPGHAAVPCACIGYATHRPSEDDDDRDDD